MGLGIPDVSGANYTVTFIRSLFFSLFVPISPKKHLGCFNNVEEYIYLLILLQILLFLLNYSLIKFNLLIILNL